jgi:periplasmic protein TonB
MESFAEEQPPPSLTAPFSASLVLHAALGALLLLPFFHGKQGESWGGPGGSISVGLVGNVPAVPMPKPDVVSENRVVDESKGLYKKEPLPPPDIPKDAVPIPKFEKLKPPPKYVTKPSKVLENPKPPPPNAVPYGGGGTPTVPTTSFAMGAGKATQAGMGFTGQGGGDFASKYGWYVAAVQSRVSMNWLQASIDPSIQFAPRTVVTFQIMRDGSIANIQIERSSGNSSVDTSVVRAVQGASKVQPLPNEYSGNFVNVEFYFDFKR